MRITSCNRPPHSRKAIFAMTASLAALLSACSSTEETPRQSAADSEQISIVASTIVWGDIAATVGGNHVQVDSIIDSPSSDPHSYEASAKDGVRLGKAELVVLNGGGYDSFAESALERSPEKPHVVATEVHSALSDAPVEDHDGDHDHSGHDHSEHDHTDLSQNEHVWYSLDTAEAVAQEIAGKLSELDPTHAAEYQNNADNFASSLSQSQSDLDAIADRHNEAPFAQTEPLASHLFAASGLRDLTPPEFMESIEGNTDPAASDLAATLALVRENKVKFLAYNTQTDTPVTKKVRSAAEEAGLPIVELSETLPSGVHYSEWMNSQVSAINDALNR